MKKFNIAVIGATGSVGREVLSTLEEREFPVNEVLAVASEDSIGKQVSFGDNRDLQITPLSKLNYSKLDFIFACTNSEISAQIAADAKKHNVIIIDKSSLFRMEENVPLIVPEANLKALNHEAKLIANPNCCVVPLVTALKPLDTVSKIQSLVISTYQSVSGAGKGAMDELYNTTKAKYMLQENDPTHFQRSIAFNVIPQIEDIAENRYTGEEQKIIEETQKILGHPIDIDVTSVRVPVFVGHCLSVSITFANEFEAIEAEEILEEAESITLIRHDSDMQYTTPVEAAGEDFVFVSRIRNNLNHANKLNMWIACDNLRKGSALNAVQIAEELIKAR